MVKKFELRPGLVSDEAFEVYSNTDLTLGVDMAGVFYVKVGMGCAEWHVLGTIADVDEFLIGLKGGET